MILLKILGLLNLLILMTKFSILIFLIVFLDPFINSPFESKSLITLFIAGVNSLYLSCIKKELFKRYLYFWCKYIY